MAEGKISAFNCNFAGGDAGVGTKVFPIGFVLIFVPKVIALPIAANATILPLESLEPSH